MNGKIGILIDANLHNQLVLRDRTGNDVTGYIESAIESFLERTEGDTGLWDEKYIEEYDEKQFCDDYADFGALDKGLLWQTILLTNRSSLRMTYKGRKFFADVKHGKIVYLGGEYTPSEWVNRIANNTSRNAWRDIWVKPHNSTQWKSAENLRWEEKQKNS